jgi:putative transposase
MSTRKVDDPIRMLGADSGISKREAGRICADLDAEIGPFRDPQRY